MTRTLGLLLAVFCSAVVHADGQPAAAPAAATTDGWIVGASNQILRLDTDGAYQIIRQVPGLRHLRVLPGTQTVVIAGDAGVELFKDGQWSSIYQGKWDHLRYSMNYRTLTVQAGNKLDITQLQPEVKNLEAYGDVQASPAERPSEGQGWLPSGRGEVAFASQFIRLAPDKPAIKVWADSNGQKLPVQFIASDDSKELEYGAVMAGQGGWLVQLDVKGHANDPGAASVPGEKVEPGIVVPLTQDAVLTQLTAPIERVMPAPAPYLAYLTGGRLEAVNLETKRPVVLRAAMADVVGVRFPDERMGDAWWVNAADPTELMAVCPAPWFNELALEGSGRCRVLKGSSLIVSVSTDIMGLVGFGPYKWPAGKPPAPVTPPMAATADLEKRPVEAATDPRPEGVVFIEGRTFFVMGDGKLQEQGKSLIKFGQEWQHSADQKVFLINAGPVQKEPGTGRDVHTGPCYILTPDACRVGSGTGRLSADSSRVWFRDQYTVQAFDTKSGRLTVLLSRPPHCGQRPSLGPEFDLIPKKRGDLFLDSGATVVVGDEAAQSWVAILNHLHHPHVYADQSHGAKVVSLWSGPTGDRVLIESDNEGHPGGYGYQPDNHWRLWDISPERAKQWTNGAYRPLLTDVLVASRFPLDLQGDTHHIDLKPWTITSPECRADGGSGALQEDQALWRANLKIEAWNKEGTVALARSRYTEGVLFTLIHLGDSVSMSAIGKGYFFLDFASDGESLLAVVDQRIADPKAVAGRQVLAKISLKTGQVTWSSQPFANCQGMVPYPDFDLKAFHNAADAGF